MQLLIHTAYSDAAQERIKLSRFDIPIQRHLWNGQVRVHLWWCPICDKLPCLGLPFFSAHLWDFFTFPFGWFFLLGSVHFGCPTFPWRSGCWFLFILVHLRVFGLPVGNWCWGVTALWECFSGQIGPVRSMSHNEFAALPFTCNTCANEERNAAPALLSS